MQKLLRSGRLLVVLWSSLVLCSGCTDALLVIGDALSAKPQQCHIEVLGDDGVRQQIRLVYDDAGKANTSTFEVQGRLTDLTGLDCMTSDMRDFEGNRAYSATGDDAVIVSDAPIDVYRPDGARVSTSVYRHGKPDGLWRLWYPDGSLHSEQVFVDGAEVNHRVWYENGQLFLERVRGVASQFYKERRWNEAGRLAFDERTFAQNGRLIRRLRRWDDDGELVTDEVSDMGPYLSAPVVPAHGR